MDRTTTDRRRRDRSIPDSYRRRRHGWLLVGTGTLFAGCVAVFVCGRLVSVPSAAPEAVGAELREPAVPQSVVDPPRGQLRSEPRSLPAGRTPLVRPATAGGRPLPPPGPPPVVETPARDPVFDQAQRERLAALVADRLRTLEREEAASPPADRPERAFRMNRMRRQLLALRTAPP